MNKKPGIFRDNVPCCGEISWKSSKPILMVSQKVVTPLKNGVQEFGNLLITLDSGFRRNDVMRAILTFYECINIAVVGAYPKLTKTML